MTQETESTFQRCPHDRENPYSQISRELIRDPNVSPQAKWLIIYLLSHQEGFNISMPYILKNQKISKNRMYSMIDQCLEAGYLKRTEYLFEGRKRFKYFISETPKFKNILLCPQNQDTEKQDPGNEDTKKEQSSSNEEEKKEQYKETPATPSPSADAEGICDFFLSKIRERNPGFQPKGKKWVYEMDCILRIDRRNLNEVKELITWASTHKWWKVACLSPAKLRRDYDVMMTARLGERENDLIRLNREYALKVKEKYPDQLKKLKFDDKFVGNRDTGKEIPFNLPHERFKETFIAIFGGSHG
jgi:hypothetical protein